MMEGIKKEECLTNEEVKLFLQDDISEAEKEKFDVHLSLCDLCCHRVATEFKAVRPEPELLRVPDYLKEQVKHQPVEKPIGFFDWVYAYRGQFAAAFGVVLIATFGIFYFIQSDGNKFAPTENPLREDASLSTAPRLLSPEKDVQITKENSDFSWSKVQGISRYRFFILDKLGNVVFQKGVQGENFSLGKSEESLRSGEIYFWYVSAQMPDGTETDSEIRKFSMR